MKKMQLKKLDSHELKALKSAILITPYLARKGFWFISSLFNLLKVS